MRAKQWAFENGYAKTNGKGRMSREAHEAIQKAIAGGMTFDDYGVKASGVIVKAKPAKTEKVKAKADKEPTGEAEGSNQYADAFIRFPNGEFGYEDDKGKTVIVNVRSACMNCGYSLRGHTCEQARVLLPSMVQQNVNLVRR